MSIFLADHCSPEILYNSVASKADRLEKIKNTTLFHEDLKANKLPQWLFISKFEKCQDIQMY
jgi:hypothetical protein